MKTLVKNGRSARRSIAVALAGCLAVLAAGPASSAQPVVYVGTGGSDLAQPDPEVIFGKLPNGLTYAVKQVKASDGASLVLYMKAGSFDEEAGERGIAHFIEHMAFRGTTHFPAGTLFPQLAQQGIAAGRDQNAGTAVYGTTYFIDLPRPPTRRSTSAPPGCATWPTACS